MNGVLSGGLVIALSAGAVWWLGTSAVPSAEVPAETTVADEAPRGATTEEVQEFDLFWGALTQLQKNSDASFAGRFREQYVNTTMDFLRLSAKERAEFTTAVDAALAELAGIQEERQRALVAAREATTAAAETALDDEDVWSQEPAAALAHRRDVWAATAERQALAAEPLLPLLTQTPRHRLLAPKRLQWLLRLHSGLRVAAD